MAKSTLYSQIRASVFLLLLASFIGTAAFAAIPPSEFVVKSMVAKRLGPKGLKIRSVIKDPASAKSVLVITVLSFSSGVVRTRFHAQSGTQEPAPKEAWIAHKASMSESNNLPTAFLPTILYSPEFVKVENNLILAGVPIRTEDYLLSLEDELARQQAEISSMKRIQGRPQWVFGVVQPPKDQKALKTPAELWVEKDRFIPTQLVSPQQNLNFDFRFESYSYAKDFPYPRRLQVWDREKEQLLLTEEVIEFTPLAQEPQELNLSAVSQVGEQELATIEDEGARALIREYVLKMR